MKKIIYFISASLAFLILFSFKNVDTPPFLGGSITNNPIIQNIWSGNIPDPINATAAVGGQCGGAYSYQWESSIDSINFYDISGATSQNYQPEALSLTTYFRRKVTCSNSIAYTSNTATVVINYQPLNPGDISPSLTLYFGKGFPHSLALNNVSGGNGNYTYQWQSSTNGTTFFNIPNETNSTYNRSQVFFQSIYYRVAVTSNGNTSYSTVALDDINPNCPRADAGPDVTVCPGGSALLGTPAIPGYSYSWVPAYQASPSAGLNNPNIAQPTSTPLSGTYVKLIMTGQDNLLSNSDFESGLSGFTTDYGTYPNGIGCNNGGVFGSISIVTDPYNIGYQYCNVSGHSTNGNNMLFVDGSCTSNLRVWSQTVTVSPNTTYYFSGFGCSASTRYGYYAPSDAAHIRLRINGVDIIANWNNAYACYEWSEFANFWNSNSATTAVIEIYDDNTKADLNDFCLDDLYFGTCPRSTDIVGVFINQNIGSTITPKGPITYYNQYESVQTLTLTCNTASSYQWYKNNVAISGATNQTYTISNIQGYQQYTDYYKCVTSCGNSNTVTFNYIGCMYDNEYPVTIPANGTCLSNYPLSLSQPNMGTGATYYWNTYNQPSYYFFTGITDIYDRTATFNISPSAPPYSSENIFTRAVATDGTEIRMCFGATADTYCRPSGFSNKDSSTLTKEILDNIKPDIFSSKNIVGTKKTKTTLYPNPANTQLNVISKGDIQLIQIIDMNGHIIKEIRGNKSDLLLININDLPIGLYLCKVSTSKGLEYLKFTVQR